MDVLSSHPDIVKHIDVFEDAADVHLVLEECRGGDLHCLIVRHQQLPEEVARTFFRTIVGAVSFCHEHGLLHRDIKPENILLQVSSGGELLPKLSDFGLCLPLHNREYRVGEEVVGSAMYAAPEVMKLRCYSQASDIWSLGALLYVMLAGYFPFQGTTFLEVGKSIDGDHLDLSSGPWQRISPVAKHLVRWMLSSQPGDRPSMAAILAHPWLTRSEPVLSLKLDPSVPSSSSRHHSLSEDGPQMMPATPPKQEGDRALVHEQRALQLFRASSSHESASFPPCSSRLHKGRRHMDQGIKPESIQPDGSKLANDSSPRGSPMLPAFEQQRSHRSLHGCCQTAAVEGTLQDGRHVDEVQEPSCDPEQQKQRESDTHSGHGPGRSKKRSATSRNGDTGGVPKRKCKDKIWGCTDVQQLPNDAKEVGQRRERRSQTSLNQSRLPGVVYHRWGEKGSMACHVAPSYRLHAASPPEMAQMAALACPPTDIPSPFPSPLLSHFLVDGLWASSAGGQHKLGMAALDILDSAFRQQGGLNLHPNVSAS
eukprot:TRINITY_DN32533_c0_g1_i1.p1 TRINITY_DN32533_c0_g1~~TRINITY_DN32533_c0_g1_i1.p1  ORF type:complete len:559 (-),score=77.45 TRINITY_DN32533_c0_g1_i1:237-1850(-)